jgi:hypothetical protein
MLVLNIDNLIIPFQAAGKLVEDFAADDIVLKGSVSI